MITLQRYQRYRAVAPTSPNQAVVVALVNRINDRKLWGYRRRTLKLVGWSYRQMKHDPEKWESLYIFAYDPNGWHADMPEIYPEADLSRLYPPGYTALLVEE